MNFVTANYVIVCVYKLMHYFKFYRTLVRSLPTLVSKKLIGWGVSPPPSPLLENQAMRRDLKIRKFYCIDKAVFTRRESGAGYSVHALANILPDQHQNSARRF